MKLVGDHWGDTYRAACATSFPKAVYVLHVFKKKSKSGIATPKPARDVIRWRLATALEHYGRYHGSEGEDNGRSKRRLAAC